MRTSKNDIEVSKHVFKVAEPFQINPDTWVHDEANAGYAIIGTNYSKDCKRCDVIYYTEYMYGELGNMVCELIEKNDSDDYGYIQCMYPGPHVVKNSGGMWIKLPD